MYGPVASFVIHQRQHPGQENPEQHLTAGARSRSRHRASSQHSSSGCHQAAGAPRPAAIVVQAVGSGDPRAYSTLFALEHPPEPREMQPSVAPRQPAPPAPDGEPGPHHLEPPPPPPEAAEAEAPRGPAGAPGPRLEGQLEAENTGLGGFQGNQGHRAHSSFEERLSAHLAELRGQAHSSSEERLSGHLVELRRQAEPSPEPGDSEISEIDSEPARSRSPRRAHVAAVQTVAEAVAILQEALEKMATVAGLMIQAEQDLVRVDVLIGLMNQETLEAAPDTVMQNLMRGRREAESARQWLGGLIRARRGP